MIPVRGHSLKLSLTRNTSRIRRTFFSQRVVTDWNRLPQRMSYRSTVYQRFLPLHATSNGAVMPSYDVRLSVRLSVCLSVTLMDADHIR